MNYFISYYTQSGKTQDRFKNTGPIVDHTFRRDFVGSFLMVSNNNGATFSTPYLTVNQSVSNHCAVRFWYYMYGDNKLMAKVKLNLYHRKINTGKEYLWSSSGNSTFPQQWIREIANGYTDKPFKFVFEAQFGSNGTAQSVAIDDISYSEGCVLSKQKQVKTTTKKEIISTTINPVTTTEQFNESTLGTEASSQETESTDSTNLTNKPTKSLSTKNPIKDNKNIKKPSHSKIYIN